MVGPTKNLFYRESGAHSGHLPLARLYLQLAECLLPKWADYLDKGLEA